MRNLNTALDLISSKGTVISGVTVDVKGYTTAGDGGAASWKFNGVTGQAPSQAPSQLGDALINDASGNQWELVHGKTVILEKLGGVAALQAALNTRAPEIAWFSSSLNLDPVRYTIYSGQHLHGPGIDKSTLFVSASLSTTLSQFENEHPNSATDGIRYDKGIKFSGFTIDGSARSFPVWLTNLAGDPITDPEFDYGPSGIIGQGGTIQDVVAADRRNPNYNVTKSLIRMVKVERPVIENVRMTGHQSMGVDDAGCLSMRVRNCVFDNHGRIDFESSAVWSQSFGNPSSPDAAYQDSEDHITEDCQFSCLRSAITLNPTKGGKFRNNHVFFAGESTVFSGSQANFNGGRIDVHGNYLGPTTITDIVAYHVENNGNSNYHIYDNYMENADDAAINIFGSSNCTVHGNTIKSPWRLSKTNYPYGPFSERYGFAVGTTPVAGNPISAGGYIVAGTLLGVGANVNVIYENTFVDENQSSNAVGILELTKSNGDNLSKNISIHTNDMNLITDKVPLLYQPVPNVMDLEMSLEAYDNKGVESGEPVTYVKELAVNETGPIEVDIGFRPRTIRVFAALKAGGSKQGCVTDITYSKSGALTSSAIFADWVRVVGTDAFRLFDGTGTVTARADFVRFTETGFFYNPIVVGAITELRMVCYP